MVAEAAEAVLWAVAGWEELFVGLLWTQAPTLQIVPGTDWQDKLPEEAKEETAVIGISQKSLLKNVEPWMEQPKS